MSPSSAIKAVSPMLELAASAIPAGLAAPARLRMAMAADGSCSQFVA
jgi:hypothetical protein